MFAVFKKYFLQHLVVLIIEFVQYKFGLLKSL